LTIKEFHNNPSNFYYFKPYPLGRAKHYYVFANKTGTKDNITNIKDGNATIRLYPIPEYVIQYF